MGILDGSRELGALVLALRARHGDAGFSAGAVTAAILELPSAASRSLAPERYGRLYVEALVRCGHLARSADGTFALGERALAFCRSRERERDLELEALARDAEPLEPLAAGAAAESDLGTVTRAFLQEVLAEAGVPAELLEAILEAYRERGRLSMSEDGGRYTIALA